jgi:hypothetical protein
MEQREQNLSTRDLVGGSASGEPTSEAAAGDPTARAASDAAVEDDRGAVPRDGQSKASDAEAAGADSAPETRPTEDGGDADEPESVSRGGESGESVEHPASTGDMAGAGDGESAALLPADENAGFQRRWEDLQTGFVDEPRRTVEQADELVAEVMKRLAEGFAAERERLEQQWGRGEEISTEDLRIALQRYRAFFQRLLSA